MDDPAVPASVFSIDGQLHPEFSAQIPVNDLAVVRGYGVFDFMRTYHGQLFMMDAHLARLRRSAAHIELSLHWTHAGLRRIIMETLTARTGGRQDVESNLRIVVTGGVSADFMVPDSPSRLIVMATPHVDPPERVYIQGVKVITVTDIQRQFPDAKTLNYIGAVRAIKRARAAGAIEALYVDAARHVLEGTTSNLFAIINGALVTAEVGVLHGITRQVVLTLAADQMPVQVRALTLDELIQADEVFLTSSNKRVVPIVQVDSQPIADGQPGPHTRALMAAFDAFAQEYAQRQSVE